MTDKLAPLVGRSKGVPHITAHSVKSLGKESQLTQVSL